MVAIALPDPDDISAQEANDIVRNAEQIEIDGNAVFGDVHISSDGEIHFTINGEEMTDNVSNWRFLGL
jgi:hypothetical protein